MLLFCTFINCAVNCRLVIQYSLIVHVCLFHLLHILITAGNQLSLYEHVQPVQSHALNSEQKGIRSNKYNLLV